MDRISLRVFSLVHESTVLVNNVQLVCGMKLPCAIHDPFPPRNARADNCTQYWLRHHTWYVSPRTSDSRKQHLCFASQAKVSTGKDQPASVSTHRSYAIQKLQLCCTGSPSIQRNTNCSVLDWAFQEQLPMTMFTYYKEEMFHMVNIGLCLNHHDCSRCCYCTNCCRIYMNTAWTTPDGNYMQKQCSYYPSSTSSLLK